MPNYRNHDCYEVLCVWILNTTKFKSCFHSAYDALQALAWCPWRPSLLASGGGTADRHIRFWNVSTGTCENIIDAKSQVLFLTLTFCTHTIKTPQHIMEKIVTERIVYETLCNNYQTLEG